MLPFSGLNIFYTLLFNPEDGNSRFLRDVGELLPDYTASHSGKWSSFHLYALHFL
jgi:hypothetical protein